MRRGCGLAERGGEAGSPQGFGHGVVWACPDGLAYFGDNGVSLLTAGIMTKEDWQAINPKTLVARGTRAPMSASTSRTACAAAS